METPGQLEKPNMTQEELMQTLGALIEEQLTAEQYESLVRCVRANGKFSAEIIKGTDGGSYLNLDWDETAGLPKDDV